MIEKVAQFVKKWEMLQKEDKVIVGVSGGADSVCLLFVLMELQKKIGFEIVVVHVNHLLRGQDAENDEIYVRNYVRNIISSVKFIGKIWNVLQRRGKKHWRKRGEM